ncbi:MAG: Leucine-rich repeat (LRR) protein [Bacillariaceae sp.]|jgi:Leucine-rich repeat (LRR) protein
MRVKKYSIDSSSNISSIDMARRVEQVQQIVDTTTTSMTHNSSFSHFNSDKDEEKIGEIELSPGVSAMAAIRKIENRRVTSAHNVDKGKQPASSEAQIQSTREINEVEKDWGNKGESKNIEDVEKYESNLPSSSIIKLINNINNNSEALKGKKMKPAKVPSLRSFSSAAKVVPSDGGGNKRNTNNESNNDHQTKEIASRLKANRAMLSLTLFGVAIEKKEEDVDVDVDLMSTSPSPPPSFPLSSTSFSSNHRYISEVDDEEEEENDEEAVAAASILAKYSSPNSATIDMVEQENRQHDNFHYQYQHQNDDTFKAKDGEEFRVIDQNNTTDNVSDDDDDDDDNENDGGDFPSTSTTLSLADASEKIKASLESTKKRSKKEEDVNERERIKAAQGLVVAAIFERNSQHARVKRELSSASSDSDSEFEFESESVSVPVSPSINKTSIYGKNASSNWWKRLGGVFRRRKKEGNNDDLEIKQLAPIAEKRESKEEEDNEKKKIAQILGSTAFKNDLLSVKLKPVEDKKEQANVKDETTGQSGIHGSLAFAAAAAKAAKMKSKSVPMTEEDYDKLYEPKKEVKVADGSLAAQAASMALAMRKSPEYYDNLYKKQREQNDEPQLMVNLKTAEYDDNLYKKPRQHNDVPQLMVQLKPVREKLSSSLHREVQEHSEGNAVGDLEENLEGPNSASSDSVSTTVESSIDKDQFNCTKQVWYRTAGYFVIILVLVAIAILVYFLAFANPKAGIDIIDPSIFPSFSPIMEPTEFITPIQSQAPSLRPTKAQLVQPETPPTIIAPTSQPIFDTVSPTPPVTIDLPTSLLTTKPTASSTLAPSQAPQLKPSTIQNLLISQWPSLEESIATPSSPQGEAFKWLTNSTSNLDAYSEQQLIQRFTMATFFYSTNGKDWLTNDGWLSEENECLWYQTKSFRNPCDASGSLLNLELDENGLSGSLPSELALLSNSLTRLELATGKKTDDSNETFIRGNLPSEVGLLTKLEYMSLSNQQISGTIPSEISELSLLTVLDLERNKFEGSIMTNIGQLQQLNNLYLGLNLLSGEIRSEFGRLRFLVNLDLYGNQFSSTIPSELGKLSYLQTISFGYNRITGTIPSSLGNLSNLQGSVDLSGNRLTGTIPSDLGHLSMILTVLNLSSNQLYGPIPTQLGGLSNLGNLQLQNNLLTGSVPSSFSGLSQLQILQLEYNNLNGSVPSSVCDVLVIDKIDDKIAPTYLVADCFTKVDCECCQYCCEEEIGCECQFSDTDHDFLCQPGKVFR